MCDETIQDESYENGGRNLTSMSFFAENEEKKIITANLINFYLIILCDISSAIVLEATFNYNTNKSEI